MKILFRDKTSKETWPGMSLIVWYIDALHVDSEHVCVCQCVLCADLNGNCVAHPLLPRLKGHYKRGVEKNCKTQSRWTPAEKQLAGHDSGIAYM